MQKIDYKTYKKPSDFVKLEQGENTVRVLTGGGLMLKHGMKTARGWVNLGECTGKGCENCKKSEPKRVWIWIAINRTTQSVGILEMGPTVGNGICELAKQLAKDPQEFDVIISRQGVGRDTVYSVTSAKTSTPLTPEEDKKIDLNKQYLINKHFKQ